MDFEVVGDVTDVETIAPGSGIRELPRLRRLYGKGRWRKMIGVAEIRLRDGGFASPNCTGMKRTASAKKSSNARGTSTRARKSTAGGRQFAVCVENAGYEVSLERNKIYVVLPDKEAEREGDLRVVDESGEDYLFSASRFVAIDVPAAVKASLLSEDCLAVARSAKADSRTQIPHLSFVRLRRASDGKPSEFPSREGCPP